MLRQQLFIIIIITILVIELYNHGNHLLSVRFQALNEFLDTAQLLSTSLACVYLGVFHLVNFNI